MHLLPAERSVHRVIDAERICQAIAALDRPEVVQARARQFAVLADPTRLTLLTRSKAAGPIGVSDLAEGHGRVVRYWLASTPVTALLSGQ